MVNLHGRGHNTYEIGVNGLMALFKGLILPGPILLSDKNPWERLSKHRGSFAPDGVFMEYVSRVFVRQQYGVRKD